MMHFSVQAKLIKGSVKDPESEVGASDAAFRKLFRFVRECDARFLDVKRNRNEIVMLGHFPFCLLW